MGLKPGLLLKILQGTGQPPTMKNYLEQNVNSTEVENFWSRLGVLNSFVFVTITLLESFETFSP